eukprot:1999082-Pyramimonas_sp.AAC.1
MRRPLPLWLKGAPDAAPNTSLASHQRWPSGASSAAVAMTGVRGVARAATPRSPGKPRTPPTNST